MLLATTGLVSVADAQEDFLKNKSGVVIETDLETLRATPAAFKSVWVSFPMQFCSVGKIANPFFTRFVPSEYANFYAWSEDQPIWRRGEYDNVFGCLFISKSNTVVDELYDLRLYDRIMVTGVVQNVFQDEPWIEVVSFERMPDKVDTASLAHLYRAELHMERREWSLAISELSLAPGDSVPDYVRAAVHKNLGVCYLRLGEAGVAQQHLEAATEIMAKPDHETMDLVQVARANPQQAIDQDIDPSGISPADRPMWEAFESDEAEAETATPQR